ncbi:hypothetical protein PP940_gp175 [Rhizobium phage RL2RES]|uniref:Uncharacterized protein n=1 Tax=Rhizobium phage RL2RES TaxID=103371 RepID=A0A6B9J3B2_9CAUD|nr:hypothetical protein PP940_gp175 [Rhizobium phage RL2RES]QGZ14273.1 hypothetical protein RL2RES_175 [Rhizobium phage RL2RES]
MTNMTDKRVIYLALHHAIDYETSFINSYPKGSTDIAVVEAKKLVENFRRVLRRYYPTDQQKREFDKKLDEGLADGSITYVNIYDLMKGKVSGD